MEVFFALFLMFIVFSIIKSESDRRKRAAQRRAQFPPRMEEAPAERDFTVPEPTTVAPDSNYYGEDVPRTTETAFQEEKKDSGKKLDFDPEEMIIYSEILKPKF
ncbi:MAG: hypothetical protein IKH93_04765 [Bacteroidales bacterium]|nr:hypothetical protein [Bacteroidales bacterium]